MTAQGHAHTAEVAFLSGMERKEEPPQAHDTVNKIGRDLFALQGMVERVASQVRNVRGPDPDAPITRDDIERMVRESARMGAIYGMQTGGGYTEAPKPDGTLKAVVIGCTVTLLCAFVLGAWTLSTQMSAFHEWQVATEKRIDHLEALRQ